MKAYPYLKEGRALLRFVNKSGVTEILRSAVILNDPKVTTPEPVPSLFHGNQPVSPNGGEFPLDITEHLLRFPTLRDGSGVLGFRILWIEAEESHEAEYAATLQKGEVAEFKAA